MHRFKTCAHEEKLETKKLVCLDVETRWNSTFLMLESALVFKRAFERLEEEDDKYKVELEKLKGTPNELDWHYVESLVHFLKIFYDATLKVSGSLYVTSNDLFHVIYGIACKLTKETSSKIESHKSMARRMKAKHDKYWGSFDNINPLLFIAVVLDPRYKLEYVCFVLDEVYGIEHGGIWTKDELFESVKGFLEVMFNDYSEMRGVTCESSSRSVGSATPNENDGSESVEDYLKKKFNRKRMEDRVGETTLSELGSTLPIDMEENFEEIEELEQELKESCLDDCTIMSDLVDDD
ncbi:unnamed protein product [Linum trigynum]|uniref:hAT-like transposase RNase-H fold domain-containing protein n=1 Tax=Linum trigynum TaxID=586398 RepID=A0AAV2E0V6_9ROSI